MKTYCIKIHRQIKAVPIFQTLNLFYLFAVLGWLWEFFLRYHMTGKIAKWGVLHGTWAPIYGVGAVLTILLAKLLAGYPVRLFVGSMIICTLVEYITSCLLEMVYRRKWWDYSNRFLNIDGRICPEVTFFFGVMCVLMIYLALPNLIRLFDKLPVVWQKKICVILTVLFMADAVLSLISPNTAGLVG